jgi:flagella basal body P-ring formation protein FlgA
MIMTIRILALAAALLAAGNAPSLAQSRDVAIPVLRASVTVAGDLVRIGDLVDNAGSAEKIAVYRAPDPGTTGSLPIAQVLATLRAHQVIGVDTRDLAAISVTRLARGIEATEIEREVARALERRNGLGDAANLSLTFDRDVQALQLDASNSGALQPTAVRFDSRSGRFDVSFEIGNDANAAPIKLRFTGIAVETVEAAVLARSVERNEVIKSSDVIVERRPKAEVGNDAAARDNVVGMQARRQLRAGQAVRVTDLAKPDLVVRDQNVTLIYESGGLYLTIRGKALEGGTEGDAINVLNLQSKRTVSGIVVGRAQVSVAVAMPRPAPANADAPVATGALEGTAPVSVAANASVPVPRRAE